MAPREFTPESRPRRHDAQSHRRVADEGGLVVQPDRAQIQVLNPVGAKVYGLLDGQHTVREIAEAVCDEFQVDEERALADVREFLAELDEKGMLSEEAATTAGEVPS